MLSLNWHLAAQFAKLWSNLREPFKSLNDDIAIEKKGSSALKKLCEIYTRHVKPEMSLCSECSFLVKMSGVGVSHITLWTRVT